jgi:hypothetical protein
MVPLRCLFVILEDLTSLVGHLIREPVEARNSMESTAMVTHIVVVFSIVWATDQDEVHDEPQSVLKIDAMPSEKHRPQRWL